MHVRPSEIRREIVCRGCGEPNNGNARLIYAHIPSIEPRLPILWIGSVHVAVDSGTMRTGQRLVFVLAFIRSPPLQMHGAIARRRRQVPQDDLEVRIRRALRQVIRAGCTADEAAARGAALVCQVITTAAPDVATRCCPRLCATTAAMARSEAHKRSQHGHGAANWLHVWGSNWPSRHARKLEQPPSGALEDAIELRLHR